MKSRKSQTALFLLLVLVFSACSSNSSRTVQVTYATLPAVTATVPPRQTTATWYLKTATPILPTPPPDDIGYYEGIIVITQYYTFLGHGHYEEAYQLLSSSEEERFPNLEVYIENGKKWFKKVRIISIVPLHSSIDSMNRRRFGVQIIAWGEGTMSGAAMSGEVQTIYLTLVKEDGEWRIESGSSP